MNNAKILCFTITPICSEIEEVSNVLLLLVAYAEICIRESRNKIAQPINKIDKYLQITIEIFSDNLSP